MSLHTRNRPGRLPRAAEGLVDPVNAITVLPVDDCRGAHARRGGHPMTEPDQWTLLAAGALRLDQLHSRAFEFYALGYEDGRNSLAAMVEQLEQDADRWYRFACDPTQQQRLVDDLLTRDRVRAHRRRSAA